MRRRSVTGRARAWFSRCSNRYALSGVFRIVAYLFAATCIVWAVLHLPLVSVRSVRVSAESDVSQDLRSDILAYVEDVLDERLYGVRGSTRHLFNRGAVVAMIQDRFLSVDEVVIESEILNRWVISVTQRETFGVSCFGSECLLIDVNGMAFGRAGIHLGHRIVVRDGLDLGDRVFGDLDGSTEDFRKLPEIMAFLEDRDLFSDHAALSRNSRVAYILLDTGIGIWLDLSESLYETTRALHVVFEEVFPDPEKRAELASVDIRDPLRIVYGKK